MNKNRNERIVELVRSGKKQADVARALGLTRERVRRVWTADIVNQMWSDYQAGMRYGEIAEKYGTYQPQVARLFKEYKFPTIGAGNYIRR